MKIALFYAGVRVAEMELDEQQRVVTSLVAREYNEPLQRLLYHGLVAGGKLVLDVDGGIFLEAAIAQLTSEEGWSAVRES